MTMTTQAQAVASRHLRAAESARRVLRTAANQIARRHAEAVARAEQIDDATLAAIGRAAVNAEIAERAVLVARAAYFRAHPAA